VRRNLSQRAKELRKNSTDAENLLWNRLRAKQLNGLKVRRQHPIGNYIVDFICIKEKIIIEVDGGQHTKEKDKEREECLEEQGYIVLRFWNNEVLTNIEGVLEAIRIALLKTPSP
jgi:very-short-patch-repair endonuclease